MRSIIATLIFLSCIPFCEAQIIYVDANAPGTNNGSSWGNAYNHLQDALSAVSPVDEIRIAGGIYRPDRSLSHPDGTKSRTTTFQLIDGITIKGGYAGFDQPDPNERDVDEYITVLSGDVNNNDEPNFVNYEDNSYHIVSFAGTTDTVILDGLTITAGNSNGSNSYNRGAAVYNNRGTLNFANCTISYNLANLCSGLYNYEGIVSLTGCSISNNKSIGEAVGGPALFNLNGTMNLTDCNFVANLAIGSGSGGRAIGCISNDQDDQWGDSYLTLNNCIFSGNQAVGGGDWGHAVGCINNVGWVNSRAFLTMTGCSFLGNQAVAVGNWGEAIGCILNSSVFDNAVAEVNMVQCVFSQNQCVVYDKGIFLGVIKNRAVDSYKAEMKIIGCQITDNNLIIGQDADEAAFISNYAYSDNSQANLTTTNCTIANNTATIGTDFITICGLYNDDGWSGGQTFFKVQNTIVTGHSDISIGMHDAYGVFDSDSSYNLIGLFVGESNLYNGIGTLYGDVFSPLDPYFVDPCNGDYHLKSQAGRWDSDSQTWVQDSLTSRCIDAGNPGFPMGDEPVDMNNVRINIGAYGGTIEASKTPADLSLLADLTNDGAVDYLDLYHWSNYWLGVTELLPSDLNRDGKTDLTDYCLFTQDWLKQIPHH